MNADNGWRFRSSLWSNILHHSDLWCAGELVRPEDVGTNRREICRFNLVFPDRQSFRARIIRTVGQSSAVMLHVTVHKIGSVMLEGVRNDDATQRVSEWIQSSLLFALCSLPVLAAVSPDVVVSCCSSC